MEFFDQIIDGIQYFINWLQTGIYQFFEDLLKEAVAWLVISKVQFQIWALGFSWEVAKTIMFNLNISTYISQAFNQLDSNTLAYITFFRIPEGLNLIIQAYITRLTLRVMGW